MNPQYVPQQLYTVSSPQNYPTSASPSINPSSTQNFQTIPLGPQKSGPPQSNPITPPQINPSPPSLPPTTLGQLPLSNVGQTFQKLPIPPNQLPPSSQPRHIPSSQFAPPPTKPSLGQNGTPQYQNGPPVQNGPGFGPQQGQLSSNLPPKQPLVTSPFLSQPQQTGFAHQPPYTNQMSASSQSHPPHPNQPPMPGQSQSPHPNQPPLPGQSQSPHPNQQPMSIQNQSPHPNQPPMSGQSQSPHPNQPPRSGQSQSTHPSQQLKTSGSQPPMASENQPLTFNKAPMPNQSQPPHPNQPPMANQNQQTFPNQSQNPKSNQSQLGQNQPPRPNQSLFTNQNQHPHPNQPPTVSHNQLSHPTQPPMPNLRPSQPPTMTQNQPIIGQPPMGQNQLSYPSQPPMMGQNQPLPGQTLMMNQNQSHPGQPPMMNQSKPLYPGQPPMPPLKTAQSPTFPGQLPAIPQNAPPTQYVQNAPPMGSNRMPPLPNQFNQPPIGGGINQPPLMGPNQLNNQMQNMNLSGPMKNQINGDNTPHMPPPLNQQQYINGQQQQQQIRGPPVGYPQPPSQPSMGAAPGMMGTYPQPNYQQAQQQNKRLDPDQMPSPIQVTQDDQRNRSGVFVTNQKGLVPPLVTTNFIVQDQGNASPRYIRSTMYNVPITQDIMKQTSVPFSLVISPMAKILDNSGEYPPPIVNFGDLGPVRCIRCKAYMCPFMQFIDSGRRFQCLFCKATTDVPSEYFQHLDHTGQRMDRFERPELVLGTYELVATTDYCRNNTLPKPPAIIFIIDVSYNNIKSGLVNLLCSQMKEIIKNLPIDQGYEKSNMKIGFITYNNSVHFYNIKGNLSAPQMLIVGDTQEMFMPLLDGFLCTPEESDNVIDALMEQIPAMFGDTRETETILLPAILAGLEALKASDCAGKLMVFHSTLPTAEAPGKLKNRDDRKLLGTEKEKTILTPQTQAYNQLGQDCVAAGCSVDLFIFNNAYIDLATIGQVSRLTGGEVYKYTYFQADVDGERLIKDIIMDISKPIAFDGIMRVRTSTGVRPTDFYGHFFMSNTTDMELAAIDCDKGISVEIKHDDKLSEDEGVYIQSALLYTSCSGQRRLRIMNLSLKTCSQMADLYRSCDTDTIINYIAKQSVYKLHDNNPKIVKDTIVSRAAQILATYRKNCASPSSAGQLILPECMKLLPLYVNCLLKSDAISGGSDMTIDDRSYNMQYVMIMDIPTSVNYFYPRLIPVHDLDPNQDPIEIPQPIRCTAEKMSEQGVYLLENGIYLFLWIGLGASPDFVQKVFGVQSAIQVDIERVKLPELDNPMSLAVRTIIDEIRIQRHRCMRLTIVRQREKLEPVFKHFLAEDRGNDGSASYVDFLIHMHKEIRSLLS